MSDIRMKQLQQKYTQELGEALEKLEENYNSTRLEAFEKLVLNYLTTHAVSYILIGRNREAIDCLLVLLSMAYRKESLKYI